MNSPPTKSFNLNRHDNNAHLLNDIYFTIYQGKCLRVLVWNSNEFQKKLRLLLNARKQNGPVEFKPDLVYAEKQLISVLVQQQRLLSGQNDLECCIIDLRFL